VVRRACGALLLALALVVFGMIAPASAQTPGPVETGQPVETVPAAQTTADQPAAAIDIKLPDGSQKPSQSVLIILMLTVLSVAPALLIMLTSFTRIAIVLSLARNALGLQGVPPNQVIVGLALFLSLFVMGPTLSQINDQALQPLLKDQISATEAYDRAVDPLRAFMLKQTRKGELQMFITASHEEKPATADDVKLTTLIPAFILSELKTAFIIGFIVFIPFLVIDIIVSSSLMSMGMMMLPPMLVSLPFKLLLFVMVDGWGLIVTSLLSSFVR
jgi:flagellar biosynthetic protein FliP